MTSVIMVKDSRHSSRRVSIRGLGGQGNPGKYHRRSGFWGMTRSLPRRRQWHTTPVLLPGKSHGRRSLVGCSPWGCEEVDMTERLHFQALEKEMATHSSALAWRIPGMGEPGGLPSMGSHGVGHDWCNLAAAYPPPFQKFYFWRNLTA